MRLEHLRLAALLEERGCVAAGDEAEELLLATGGDRSRLAAAVARRLRGEPLAWICGTAEVDGLRLVVEPGTYVPRRWQTPAVAAEAAARLPADGTAVDLCTGSGAVAVLLRRARPRARILATDCDAAAVRCARSNGVEALCGDLFSPLLPGLAGQVDLITAVAPYVPTSALSLLPRDSVNHEPRRALDGGPDGLTTIRRIAASAPTWLRPGGSLVLEHGQDQEGGVTSVLAAAGLHERSAILDRDGEACGSAAVLPT